MRLILSLAAIAVLTAAPIARADTYRYAFAFSNLSNKDANFTLNIDTPGLISTTGLASLSTPLPTTLGYSVNNFGENSSGEFLFSQSGGSISDIGVGFSPTSFDFEPVPPSSAYDTVGIYSGATFGNGPSYFSGSATLTVTHLTPVAATPEPSSIALLGTGLLGVAAAMRRRLS